MPPIDTEGQFKFLLCCIKHSAAGKVSRRPSFPPVAGRDTPNVGPHSDLGH